MSKIINAADARKMIQSTREEVVMKYIETFFSVRARQSFMEGNDWAEGDLLIPVLEYSEMEKMLSRRRADTKVTDLIKRKLVEYGYEPVIVTKSRSGANYKITIFIQVPDVKPLPRPTK